MIQNDKSVAILDKNLLDKLLTNEGRRKVLEMYQAKQDRLSGKAIKERPQEETERYLEAVATILAGAIGVTDIQFAGRSEEARNTHLTLLEICEKYGDFNNAIRIATALGDIELERVYKSLANLLNY